MNDEKVNQTSFVGHLTELRSRLVKSIIYLFIFFVICYFFAENIYRFLVEPYAEAVRDGLELEYEKAPVWNQAGTDCPSDFVAQVQVETDCDIGGVKVTLGNPGTDTGAIFEIVLVIEGAKQTTEYELDADDTYILDFAIEDDSEWFIEWQAKEISEEESLAFLKPEFIQFWDRKKNEKDPFKIRPTYGASTWWKCKKGHSFRSSPNTVTSKEDKRKEIQNILNG